jgi:hypothetical protein
MSSVKYVHAHAVSNVLESVSDVPDSVTWTLLTVQRSEPEPYGDLKPIGRLSTLGGAE